MEWCVICKKVPGAYRVGAGSVLIISFTVLIIKESIISFWKAQATEAGSGLVLKSLKKVSSHSHISTRRKTFQFYILNVTAGSISLSSATSLSCRLWQHIPNLPAHICVSYPLLASPTPAPCLSQVNLHSASIVCFLRCTWNCMARLLNTCQGLSPLQVSETFRIHCSLAYLLLQPYLPSFSPILPVPASP